MKIEKMSPQWESAAAVMFNACAEGETVYRKIEEKDFIPLFFRSTDDVKKVNIAAVDDAKAAIASADADADGAAHAAADDTAPEKAVTDNASAAGSLAGFASGTLVRGKKIGYVTFVLVDPARRFEGIGTQLLKKLEEALIEEAKAWEDITLEKIQMIFFNPVALTWVIPRTDRHDHPNAPGVDVASGAYIFFKNQGYTDRVFQNSYYIPLENYHFPEDMQRKLEELKEQGLAIGYYDPALNFGLEELTDNLESEDWKRELLGNAAREDGGDPLIVAIDAGAEHKDEIVTDRLGKAAGKVVGFTGPIHVQESGRGYFAGIGVHSDYRKLGLGTCLFASLCRGQQEIGSKFMSLFTGETNPARRIYRGAGFKIVRTWSDMEKFL